MGILVGLALGFIIAILPAILVLFSKLVSGKGKAIWVFSILVVPYLLKIVASTFVLIIQGNTFPYGLGPVIPLTWYISAWTIYFYFKNKYGDLQDKKHTKIVTVIFVSILLISILYLVSKSYIQQEDKIIVDCGSEKIFTKNLEPTKLYLTHSYISKNASFYIGELDKNDIILKSDFNGVRSLKTCLRYSNKYNVIYPAGSKYNKTWKWEKHTYEIDSTLLFSSKEMMCSPVKQDKDENYDYMKWRNNHSFRSIKTNKDSFLFEVNNAVYTTKAETLEFSSHFLGCSYSNSNLKYRYIFRRSINDSSKIILWKFSKNGDFVKEMHIVLPNNMLLEEGKSYPISHIEIKKDTIQFRVYKIYRGNKDQKWRYMCSYDVLKVDNL